MPQMPPIATPKSARTMKKVVTLGAKAVRTANSE